MRACYHNDVNSTPMFRSNRGCAQKMKQAKVVTRWLAVLAVSVLAAGCASAPPARDHGDATGAAKRQPVAAAEQKPLGILDGHRLGNPGAPLVVVEFTDFQCPFCRRYHDSVFPEIKRNFVDTGIAQYVVWDFPLNMHPHAPGAAVAADCAEEQGQYWRMRDRLFENQERLGRPLYTELAKELGLDTTKFEACLDSGAAFGAVRRSLIFGMRLGINATPTVLIGRVKDGKVDLVTGVAGVPDYESFASEIEKLRH
jgi:protein-disulfide isomerase